MRQRIHAITAACLATACSLLAGCGASPGLRPARISHVVLIKLADPDEREALLADCDEALPRIPGVVAYAAGRHLDVGRANVDGGYDLGLYIGFETEAAYAGYVDHPLHTGLVEAWKPRIEWMRVHDVLDETP
jgi:hypothetical protein